MSTRPTLLDPVTVEVIRNGLAAAAREMNRTLVRTAFNPLLYEVQDFGLGIVSADGRLWAEAPGIAGFISALSDTVLVQAGHRGRSIAADPRQRAVTTSTGWSGAPCP